MTPRLFSFVGGSIGPWRVTSVATIAGAPLTGVSRLSIGSTPDPHVTAQAEWTLRGITSNERYVTREEKDALIGKQPELGRPQAVCAALITILKSPEWWSLPQDERRAVFEAQSRHVAIGLTFLPAVARRLHHCRDLGPDEPFDFLTWFEFSRADARAFDELVARLRESPEWRYITREVDLRLEREPS